MTLIELKAEAYDLIHDLEFLKMKLKEVNDQIAEKMKEANDNNEVSS